MTLADIVDYFVLVEADVTFTGKKKEFEFEKNRSRYKKYLDRIIHIKVEDTPEPFKDDVWAREYFQRNCIVRGLAKAKKEDRIIISDVDEIPDPDAILQVKDKNHPVTFNQYLFYYYVNCASNRSWNGSIISPFENMPPPQALRKLARRGLNRIKNSGWHYSYMGGVDRIRSKLDNLSDAFMRRELVGTDDDILRKINSQKDLWDEKSNHRLIDIEEGNYSPKSMKEFLKKYPGFYFNR